MQNLQACEQLQKFWEHDQQASTRLNFASKSSKGNILLAVKNFYGPFITPFVTSQYFRLQFLFSVSFKNVLM